MLLSVNFANNSVFKKYPVHQSDVNSWMEWFEKEGLLSSSFSYETFDESDIHLGDKYINIMAPQLGVRIADEETLRRITFAKSINFGTCYYKKYTS